MAEQHVEVEVHGNCTEAHLSMLHKLVLTHKDSPSTDFSSPPWSEGLLITLRQAVQMKWNSMSVKVCCNA